MVLFLNMAFMNGIKDIFSVDNSLPFLRVPVNAFQYFCLGTVDVDDIVDLEDLDILIPGMVLQTAEFLTTNLDSS